VPGGGVAQVKSDQLGGSARLAQAGPLFDLLPHLGGDGLLASVSMDRQMNRSRATLLGLAVGAFALLQLTASQAQTSTQTEMSPPDVFFFVPCINDRINGGEGVPRPDHEGGP